MINKINVFNLIIITVVVGMLAGFIPAVSATSQEAGVVMVPNNFSQLAKDAKPSVVNIRTVSNGQRGGQGFQTFFWSAPQRPEESL